MKNGRFNFVSIKTVLSKFYRDLKDTSIEEIDLIEWVGEAMGFMKNPQILEEAVAFLKVENNQTIIPNGFQAVIQVARNNAYVEETKCSCDDECDCEITIDRDKVCEEITTTTTTFVPDTEGDPIDELILTGAGTPCTQINVVEISNSPLTFRIAVPYTGQLAEGKTISPGQQAHVIKIGDCIFDILALPGQEGLTHTLHFGEDGIQFEINEGMPSFNPFINCLFNTYFGAILPQDHEQCINDLEVQVFEKVYPLIEVITESKTIKQLIRIKKYNKGVLTETTYEDCNGYAYTLVGTIVNCPSNICEPCTGFDNEVSIYDECGKKIMETTYAKYFSMKTPFNYWVKSNNYVQNYIPIRLSNHTFFNSVVCKLDNPIYNDPKYYPNTQDEYTIVGDYPSRVLRFSFQEGQVALAYLKSQTDDEGFPLIPDDSDCHSAIVYYLKWKIAERLAWSGREGYDRLGKEAEAHWLRYIKQFKSKSKMPYSLDDYKNIQENSYYLIPNLNKDFGFFGQLYK